MNKIFFSITFLAAMHTSTTQAMFSKFKNVTSQVRKITQFPGAVSNRNLTYPINQNYSWHNNNNNYDNTNSPNNFDEGVPLKPFPTLPTQKICKDDNKTSSCSTENNFTDETLRKKQIEKLIKLFNGQSGYTESNFADKTIPKDEIDGLFTIFNEQFGIDVYNVKIECKTTIIQHESVLYEFEFFILKNGDNKNLDTILLIGLPNLGLFFSKNKDRGFLISKWKTGILSINRKMFQQYLLEQKEMGSQDQTIFFILGLLKKPDDLITVDLLKKELEDLIKATFCGMNAYNETYPDDKFIETYNKEFLDYTFFKV